LKNCEEARAKLKKSENMMVEIRAALNMVSSILKSPVVILYFKNIKLKFYIKV
jgi:hypothetical protein